MLFTRQKFLFLVIIVFLAIVFYLVHNHVTPIVPGTITGILKKSDNAAVSGSPSKITYSLPEGLRLLDFEQVKVTNDMTPQTAEENFYKFVTQKHVSCARTVRLGNMLDGGWDMCVVEPFAPKKPCTVYSFGINNDWSFDDSVSRKYGCNVRAFDPSMRIGDHKHSSLVYFYHTGIGESNTYNKQGWKIRTLATLLKDIGDQNRVIDYLKMDIEYNEWTSFSGMFSENALKNVKQFSFEIHTHELLNGSPSSVAQFAMYYETLKKLEDLGFKRFHYHMNPLGFYNSHRTSKRLSCCYELYYVNMNFLSNSAPKAPPEVPVTTTTTTTTTIKPTTAVNSASVIPSRLPDGLTLLKPAEVEFSAGMSPQTIEFNFYRYVRQIQVSCDKQTRAGNAGDGGWDMCMVPPYAPESPCIIYSFGINNDWSFDDSVSQRFGCTVRAFDPSMRMHDHKHSKMVWFYQTGIGDRNTINSSGWKIRTLSTLFKELGDSDHVIDYLKIDIEYNEWDSFRVMFEENALKNVKQFGLEIHTHELAGGSPSTVSQFMTYVNTLKTLESKGFRRFLSHLNPYGKYMSRRTGREQSCCYELYYINMHFLNRKENSGASQPSSVISKKPVLVADVASGIVPLHYEKVELSPSLGAAEAEERFYRFLTTDHIKCPKKVRMGNWGDGGWEVCVSGPYKPHDPCTIYSFGINNDWSFDDAMSSTFQCEVKAFDPSMHMGDHKHSKLVWFYHTGIGGHNTVNSNGWKIKTLRTLLQELGDLNHDIDYLKIDIEYNEWDSFDAMFNENALARVKQFGFEIHTHELAGGSATSVQQFYDYYRILKKLEDSGFKKYHHHLNPYGWYNSIRTGKRKSCCYELYYINTKYLIR